MSDSSEDAGDTGLRTTNAGHGRGIGEKESTAQSRQELERLGRPIDVRKSRNGADEARA